MESGGLSIETLETIRTVIIATGWPILILGSVYLMIRALVFYHQVAHGVYGRLVLAMVIGWLVSMYSLGVASTAYMFDDLEQGVFVVLPIFFVWFVTMIVIIWAVSRWSREAVTLAAFHRGLEELVKTRTSQLEEAYKTQLEKERELRQLRERFVFVAAHELRAPVTAIEWGLKTLLEDAAFQKSLPEEYRKLLEELRAKNENLLELVRNLLNVARLQSGPPILELEKVSLASVLSEVKENISPLAAEKRIEVRWPLLKEALPWVKTHPLSLREVLTNLLVNAIRYNKPGGWIDVRIELREHEVVIHVKDSGIGMDEEEMKNLFKEFHRIKSQETENIEGTGLGLFIVKQLLERMQGKIWVASKKGEGSTFSFSLPRA